MQHVPVLDRALDLFATAGNHLRFVRSNSLFQSSRTGYNLLNASQKVRRITYAVIESLPSV